MIQPCSIVPDAVLSARITGSANLAVMKPESRNTFGLTDNSLTGTQKALLDKALEIVRDHMSDPDFSNEVFIKEMGMCKTVLYEKLRTPVFNGHFKNFKKSVFAVATS